MDLGKSILTGSSINGVQPTEQTPAFQPIKPLPRNLTVSPITLASLPAYRRLITTLLPIRYPDKFYQDSIEGAAHDSIALCALWHEPGTPEPKVIAGIQCRRLPARLPPSPISTTPQQEDLYIQTLATIAPYRYLGVATALLDAVVETAVTTHENVTSIYAHVWEANTDALQWYQRRGFLIEEGMVQGYYRKLRPCGARVVRRRFGMGDYLRAKGSLQNSIEKVNVNTEDQEELGEGNHSPNG